MKFKILPGVAPVRPFDYAQLHFNEGWIGNVRSLVRISIVLLVVGIGQSILAMKKPDKLFSLKIEQVNKTVKTEIANRNLIQAAEKGDIKMAELALVQGADINCKNNETNATTPLALACIWGKKEIVQFFLANGAHVNAVDTKWGNTPLHWTSIMGYKDRPDFQDRLDIASLLLEHGADLNRKNNVGTTALDLAQRFEQTEIIERMLKKKLN